MAFQKFYISPYGSGLVTRPKPFLLPEEAFARLENAYVYRGVVRKRPGSQLLDLSVLAGERPFRSRLRMLIGTTAAPVAIPIPGTALGEPANLLVGQSFSIGPDEFDVYQLGAGVVTYSTNPGITCTIDDTVTPQVVTFAGAGLPGATNIYWYPALPVMGFVNYEGNLINNDNTFAFDSNFAYQWTGAGWDRLAGGGAAALWTNQYNINSGQFYWGCNYRGVNSFDNILFVTNNVDNIRFYDGANWNNRVYDTLQIAGAPNINTMLTARLLVPFGSRLLAMNTTENVWNPTTAAMENHQFVNRIRYSKIGDPTQPSNVVGPPAIVGSFMQQSDGGGFIDIPTREHIVTAEFVRDRLIVFCERSTWEVINLANDLQPFDVRKLNTELGAESTFSVVPFDKVCMAIGQAGIHICDGIQVTRIDMPIPNEVWDIFNQGLAPWRVSGVRDYYTENVYWAFPEQDINNVNAYNNKVLCYDYAQNCWAFFDDNITVFGSWYPTADATNGLYQAGQRQVIAGNQEGFTFIIHPDLTRNAPSLQITNFVAGTPATLTVVDHNLDTGDFVLIENAQGAGININNNIYQIIRLTDDTFTISSGAGVYEGGGTVALVSQIDILTKEYNFFNKEGNVAHISEVDFLMDRVFQGEFTIDYYVSSASATSMLTAGALSGARLGTGGLSTDANALYSFESVQDRVWHPTFLQAEGHVIQMRLYWTSAQTIIYNNAIGDWQLNAMCIHARPISRLQ